MKARFALLLIDMVMILLFTLVLVAHVSQRLITLMRGWFSLNQPG